MSDAIENPEDTGASRLQPRDALLRAIDAVRRGMGDTELKQKFGEFAALKARETWRGLHLKQWGTRAAAMAILTHEMQDGYSKPLDRILAAKGALEAIDRHQTFQEKMDSSLLSDVQLRERAIEEWRRPSKVMVDLIVDAWSDPTEAMIGEILERVLPNYATLLEALGYVKKPDA